MKNFKDTYNIANVDNWDSLKGYAGQELAFGRLMLCGFNVQRNLWRDAKYDGIFVKDKFQHNNTQVGIKKAVNKIIIKAKPSIPKIRLILMEFNQ